MPPDSKETELGTSDQEASPSAGKNSVVVLVRCRAWKCPYSYFRWCEHFWGPWVSFVTTDEFSVRVKKLFRGSVSHELTAYLSGFDLFLAQLIMAISAFQLNLKNWFTKKIAWKRQNWITKAGGGSRGGGVLWTPLVGSRGKAPENFWILVLQTSLNYVSWHLFLFKILIF